MVIEGSKAIYPNACGHACRQPGEPVSQSKRRCHPRAANNPLDGGILVTRRACKRRVPGLCLGMELQAASYRV